MHFLQEAEQLEREQEVLRDNVKKLQAQKRKLGSILDEHEPSCTNKVEELPADTTTSEKKVETAWTRTNITAKRVNVLRRPSASNGRPKR